VIDAAILRDRIRLLREVDRDLHVFGAATHRYQLAAPLGEEQVRQLEARLGVELPAEYRTFLREIGSRGAGPYYGMLEASADEGAQAAREFTGTSFDGTIAIAEQGCAYRSLLVVSGPRRGEVWSDFIAGDGGIVPEAASFGAWYAAWTEHALVEWLELAAPRIALDGPEDPAELEAIGTGFEAVAAAAKTTPAYRRTLGYLHLREHRYDDAVAAFVAAADGGKEPESRLHLDRARVHVVKDDPVRAIEEARAGLQCEGVWSSTRDELRATLERALFASNRTDDALAVLDERAAERYFSLDLHHRLARERLARGDLAGAGAALERAAQLDQVMGRPAPREVRVAAAFDPIVAELRAGGRSVDAEALESLAERILQAN
jgi:hypothetical protein